MSKLFIYLFTFITGTSSLCYSQTDTTQGIFPTSQHYTNDSVLNIPEGKLKMNFLFNSDVIVLKNGTQKIKFDKDSIYGYCKENICYRFYKGEEYKIEDTGMIYIYSRTILETDSKISTKKTTLYFSPDEDAAILPLTVHNIIAVLKFNSEIAFEFHETFDDTSILKHHPEKPKYDINLFLENKLK